MQKHLIRREANRRVVVVVGLGARRLADAPRRRVDHRQKRALRLQRRGPFPLDERRNLGWIRRAHRKLELAGEGGCGFESLLGQPREGAEHDLVERAGHLGVERRGGHDVAVLAVEKGVARARTAKEALARQRFPEDDAHGEDVGA
jgi:hypothetical protein